MRRNGPPIMRSATPSARITKFSHWIKLAASEHSRAANQIIEGVTSYYFTTSTGTFAPASTLWLTLPVYSFRPERPLLPITIISYSR